MLKRSRSGRWRRKVFLIVGSLFVLGAIPVILLWVEVIPVPKIVDRSVDPSTAKTILKVFGISAATFLSLLILIGVMASALKAIEEWVVRPLRWLVKLAIPHKSARPTTVRLSPYRTLATAADFDAAMTSWGSDFFENKPLMYQTWQHFANVLYTAPDKHPVNFSSGHRFYVIVGPPGTGKSTFLLYSLANMLRITGERSSLPRFFRIGPFKKPKPPKSKGQPTVPFVALLNVQSWETWIDALSVEARKEGIIVLDGARRDRDPDVNVFRERMKQLSKLAGGSLDEIRNDEAAVTISMRAAVTMRMEDWQELKANPPDNWPGQSDVAVIQMAPLEPNSETFADLVNRYARHCNVDLGERGASVNTVTQLGNKSNGNIRLTVSTLYDHQGKRLTPNDLQRIPSSYVDYLARHLESRFNVTLENNPAMKFVLCLLVDSRVALSEDSLRFAWHELQGSAHKDKLNQLLQSRDFGSRRHGYLLDGHYRETLTKLLNQPESAPFHSIGTDFAAYWRITYESHLLQVATRAFERLAENGLKPNNIALLIDYGSLRDKHLKKAISLFEAARGMLDGESIRRVSIWLYEELTYQALKKRRARHNLDAIKCYERAFKYTTSDIDDSLYHRLQLHRYVSLLRRFGLPEAGSNSYSDVVDKIRRTYKKLFEIESELVDSGLLPSLHPVTIHEHAQFLWKASGYPYHDAEAEFKRAIEVAKTQWGFSRLVAATQGYAVFLNRRGNEAYDRLRELHMSKVDKQSYVNRLTLDYTEAQELFECLERQFTDFAALRALSFDYYRVEGPFLIAYSRFLLDRARSALKYGDRPTLAERKVASETDNRRALDLLRIAVKKYPMSDRPANALADALLRVGPHLPEEQDRWKSEAERELRRVISISTSKKWYDHASISISTLATLMLRQGGGDSSGEDRAASLLRDALKQPLSKRQKAILSHQLVNVLHSQVASFLERLAKDDELAPLMREAHSILIEALNRLQTIPENVTQRMLFDCAWADHYRLVGNSARSAEFENRARRIYSRSHESAQLGRRISSLELKHSGAFCPICNDKTLE